MEKFARISRITNEYLHGTLQKLTVEYDGPKKVHIMISYEDLNNYWFDYELDVNVLEHKIDFNAHRLSSTLDRVKISRDQGFEKALEALF